MGMSYREVWNKGDRLKKFRVDADYRSDASINAETAAASIKLADRVIECLGQIRSKTPISQP